MSAMALAKYDAVGIGEADLRVCGDQFFDEAAKHKLTVIDTRSNAPKTTVPFVIKNVDGVKVGIVSFGGAPLDEGADESQRRRAMYSAFKAAREASDILVLLDQGNIITPDWLERNEKRLGVPDVVVSGTARSGLLEPEVQGKTRIVPTSTQTRQVGVLDIEFTPGQEPKYAWNRIENTEELPKDEVVQKLIEEFTSQTTVAASPHSSTPAAPPMTTPGTHTAPANLAAKPYYPPDLCKPCHVKQFDDWVRSKHAQAVKTLMQANRMVAECLKCHSEQFRRLGNVSVSPSGIGGVDCTTCHIDSLPHGMERKAVAQRSKVDAKGCLECHTKERSAAYDEQIYFPKVSHLEASGTEAGSSSNGDLE